MTWSSALRRIARRLAREGRRTPPTSTDAGLLALAEAFVAGDRALHVLLEDGRDTDDIPGYAALADRRAELARRIAATPARNLAGLLAKARCGRLDPAERGFDAGVAICASLADDLLRIGGASVPFSLDPLRSSPDARPPEMKEQTMNKNHEIDTAHRLAILRHNELLRQASQALAMVGACAVVALAGLPANGVDLTPTGIATLVTTAVAALGASFVVLRFMDHRA